MTQATDSAPRLQAASRSWVVDALKAFAAQCIVLHHLAWYGPLSHLAKPLIEPIRFWFEEYGLLAVQAFLVMGGYLAIQGMTLAADWRLSTLLHKWRQRYQRLVLPLAAAMLLAIVCSALANALAPHDATPDVSDAADVLLRLAAHLALLHSILGVDALSAGVWYVAIDFQLYVLLALLVWAVSRVSKGQPNAPAWLNSGLLVAVMLVLAVFNRNPDLDIWGIYFFGAYGLGALAYRLAQVPGVTGRRQWVLVMVAVLLALNVDYRIRIALALAVATLLYLSELAKPMAQGVGVQVLAYLSKISYAVFLVHFPVCLVVNAAFVRWLNPDAGIATVGVVCAWALSLVTGALFERWVEQPLRRML